MGRRRHRRRLAERPDAAARALVQRRERKGARGGEIVASCRSRTGAGRRCSGPTRTASFPIRPRPICSMACASRSTCCTRKASTTCSRATTAIAEATRRAVRAWGLEILCLNPAEYSQLAHRGDDARRAQRGRLPQSRARPFRHVARQRARQGRGQGIPHRPPRRLQRSDAHGHARRRRNGPGARRRAAPERRRGGGDGLSHRRRERSRQPAVKTLNAA